MPERVFLDWSEPLLPSLAERLLPAEGNGPLDLGDRLILAPTRQAGRRLREYLATAWRERGGTALLSMEVQPPSVMLQPDEEDNAAHAFDWMRIWQQTLTGTDPETLPALLPRQKESFSPAAALEFGQRLQRLREELLDAGLDLVTAAESPLLLSEKERWRDLARLEGLYREGLEKAGLKDPVDAKREHLAAYTPAEGVKKLLLAGVPDPSPVVLQRLKELDALPDLEIEVWIHAQPSEAENFDEWGIPAPVWQTRSIGRAEEPDGWLECLADPPALCERLKELVEEFPEQPDLAFGLLEDDLALPIQHVLQSCGRDLYHPKPVPLGESPDVRLLEILREQAVNRDPVSLRALWRHPAVLETLSPEDPRGLLREWETFAAEAFPEQVDAVDEADCGESLREAWKKLRTWVNIKDAAGYLELLSEVHSGHQLNPEEPGERYRLRQLQRVSELLQEAARRSRLGKEPGAEVLLQVLREEKVDPPRVEGTFTAEGWLELAYHPAPSLLLCGFQEGNVPSVNLPDPFLPRQLREELGLKSDRDWLARDAYLFHSMIMSRQPGQVRVWVLKRDREGSPLLPSRLLFACEEKQMLQRAEFLFREPEAPGLQPAPSPGLTFQPGNLPQKPIEKLSVSAIKDYLHCPSRFYFRHVLGLRLRDDVETEPHAGVFGEVVHEVLGNVVNQGPCPLPEWNRRTEEALAQQMQKRFGSTGRMSMQVFRHAALSRLRAAGPEQQRLWEEGWRPLASERKFTRDCLGITISGRIDRIDVHPELGFRIMDYKTHDSPSPPEKTHLGTPREGREMIQLMVGNRLKQWTDLQLPLYRWLAETAKEIDSSRPLDVYYFNLPKAAQDCKMVHWPQEEEVAEEARDCLHTVLELIQAQVWLPTSPPGRYDDFTPLLHHGNDWIPKPD